jgi:hypothetical protein
MENNMAIGLKISYNQSQFIPSNNSECTTQVALHLHHASINNETPDVICQDHVQVGDVIYLVTTRYVQYDYEANNNCCSGLFEFLAAFKNLNDAEKLKENVYSQAGSFCFNHENGSNQYIYSVWSSNFSELEYVQINQLKII